MPLNSPKIEHFSISNQLHYTLLNLEEFALCFNLNNKRTIEKMAALYVVRNVLKDESIEIFYKENGKPYLNTNKFISISHSHEWLAVLFSDAKECGIDLEKVRPKILNIKEKYLSDTELEELKNAPIEKYTLYWCAKEALYKACGISGLLFAEQIFIEPFIYAQQGGKIKAQINHVTFEKKVTLHYAILDDYILVYTENTSA